MHKHFRPPPPPPSQLRPGSLSTNCPARFTRLGSTDCGDPASSRQGGERQGWRRRHAMRSACAEEAATLAASRFARLRIAPSCPPRQKGFNRPEGLVEGTRLSCGWGFFGGCSRRQPDQKGKGIFASIAVFPGHGLPVRIVNSTPAPRKGTAATPLPNHMDGGEKVAWL
ncbi:hypothetical protein VTI28DRAFT_5431 [Corynascus sepedonium]